MSKPTYVVDASTCLKWILNDEILAENALLLLKDYLQNKVALVAPNLWLYEVTNGIKSAVSRSRISPGNSERLLKLILKSKPEMVSLEDVLPECLNNAIEFDVSAYDSTYITLAQINNLPFITGDQKLANKSFSKTKLLPLKDYPV